jgi:hypothetical protein
MWLAPPLSCIDINMKLTRKQSRLCPLLSITAVMVFVFSSEAAAENCVFDATSKTITMNYGSKLTEGLSVPPDASIGTVIYRESISTPLQKFYCSGASILFGFVMNPALGSAPPRPRRHYLSFG